MGLGPTKIVCTAPHFISKFESNHFIGSKTAPQAEGTITAAGLARETSTAAKAGASSARKRATRPESARSETAAETAVETEDREDPADRLLTALTRGIGDTHEERYPMTRETEGASTAGTEEATIPVTEDPKEAEAAATKGETTTDATPDL